MDYHVYEYVVIGAGSGGLASARRAAKLLQSSANGDPEDGEKRKVAIIENHRVGGTCVNVGCVPKKLMFQTSQLAEALKLFEWYGFENTGLKSVSDDWGFLRDKVEVEMNRSNLIKALRQKKRESEKEFDQGGQNAKSKNRHDVVSTNNHEKNLRHPSDPVHKRSRGLHGLTTAQKEFLVDVEKSDKTEIGFDWATQKSNRDEYIRRLHGIYRAGLEREHVDLLQSGPEGAHFTGEFCEVTLSDGSTAKRPLIKLDDDRTLTGKTILIATGGQPILPESTNGACEFGITSDEFFSLEHQPERVAVIGSGYVAVELAGIFNSLGSQVIMFIRGNRVLRHNFDPDVSMALHEEMIKSGITIKRNCLVDKISKDPETHMFNLDFSHCDVDCPSEGSSKSGNIAVDLALFAVGRIPNTEALHVDKINLQKDKNGYLVVNGQGETNLPGLYAIGDNTKRYSHLTPVAIMAGRRLADLLFCIKAKKTGDYAELLSCGGKLIPTVVFSHPPIGVIGMSEPEVRSQYPESSVRVYKTRFTSMTYGLVPPGHVDRHLTLFKIITVVDSDEDDEYIKGIHLMGDRVDEILQGFALAMTTAFKLTGGKGIRLSDFYDTVPIHPTSAEELVTIK